MLWTPLAELILGLTWLRSILQSKPVRVAHSFARNGGVVLEDLPSLLRHGGKSGDGSPNVVLERLEDASQSIPLLHTKNSGEALIFAGTFCCLAGEMPNGIKQRVMLNLF